MTAFGRNRRNATFENIGINKVTEFGGLEEMESLNIVRMEEIQSLRAGRMGKRHLLYAGRMEKMQ